LGELYVASIKGSGVVKISQLTFFNPGVRGVSWSPDGKSIFFGSMNGGSLPGIWRFNQADSSLALVTPAGLVAISPNVSRDGSEILFSAPLSELNLWQYQAAEQLAPHAFEPLTALQITPSISPDGKMIVFASDMSGTMELWVSPIANPAPRQITSFSGDGIPVFPSWSADSRKVVFFCRKKGLNYAYEVPAEGGSLRLLRGGADYTLFPQYSPDNKWLYYVSNYGHRFRIWRVSLSNLSSQPEEMTMQDVSYFRLAQDGKALYFSSRDGMTTVLNRKDIATGQVQTIWEWKDIPLGLCDWDVSGHRLYFVFPNPESLTSHLVTADLDTRAQRDLGKVRTTYWFGTTSIAAAPDGNSVWVSKVDRGDNNIMSLRLQ
jgi:Tol biopolymer transport system component